MLEASSSASEDPFGLSPGAKSSWCLPGRLELKLVLGIVLAQVLILISMIVLDAAPLVLGERIKLRVTPVDPRDLFRGDYVVLNYDFNRIAPGQVAGLSSGRD